MKTIISKSKILLPNDTVDLAKWSVVACDQFTSEAVYWQTVANTVGQACSTLNIVLPEVYLETNDVDSRIANIQKSMENYSENILTKCIDGMMYVERDTGRKQVRQGLVVAIELDDYSYDKAETLLIRPSENTVVERIPPRLAVRENACLETPHIMMLIDDASCNIIEPLKNQKETFEKCYDITLMQDGGSIKGYAITDEKTITDLQNKFSYLASQEFFDITYPKAKGDKPIAMIAGDGNHSLATAKAYWEQLKLTLTEQEIKTHPARLCLVEIVNIHSDSIEIEPIHRAVFGLSETEFFARATTFFAENKNLNNNTQHIFNIVTKNGTKQLTVDNPNGEIQTATIENFIDYLLKNDTSLKVDYLHGTQIVHKLAADGAIGILLPDFEKSDLFKGVVAGGVLPRKTFSMGNAEEKRYYMECRKIK